MSSRSLMGVVGLAAALSSSPALARPLVVVLAFGGEQGTEVRDRLVAALTRKYDIVHGQKLLEACDRLGITMSRGKNLAAAATDLGAVAVVGGTVKGGRLELAVYSGKTGQPLAAGSVAFSGEITRPFLGKALILILKGLQKAPKKVTRAGPRPAPVAPMPEPRGGGGGDIKAGGSLTYDPNAPDSSAGAAAAAGQPAAAEENPLAPPPRPVTVAPPPSTVTAQSSDRPHPTRAQAMLGLGSWMRSFSMNEPAQQLPPGMKAPIYTSAAVTLKLDVRLYPVAFFLDNWPAGFIIHLQYQEALGLSSQSPQLNLSTGKEEPEDFGTTMRQVLLGFGYDWKVLPSAALSPHVELKIGFGMMDFGIDWQPTANVTTPKVTMPSSSYRFFLLDFGVRHDFFTWLGAHLGFDYRALSGTGQIEEDAWFGPSSTGGINFSLGAHSCWKGITASVDYAYTRYFYSFTDTAARAAVNTPTSVTKAVAGGALDVMNTFMISVGYRY